MITEWSLQYFKGIVDARLRLNALTIVAGTNSSGKSTVIQSLAVVAQTLSAALDSEAMVLNGHLVSLGAFSDLGTRGHVGDPRISWKMEPKDADDAVDDPGLVEAVTYDSKSAVGLDTVSCSVTFAAPDPSTSKPCVKNGVVAVQPIGAPPSELSWTLTTNPGAECEYRPVLDAHSVTLLEKRHPNAQLSGCELRHFLPSRVIIDVDVAEEHAILRASAVCLQRGFYRPNEHPLLNVAAPDALIQVLEPVVGEMSRGSTFAAIIGRVSAYASGNASARDELAHLQPKVLTVLLQGHEPRIEAQRTYLPGRLPDAVSYVESYFATKFHYLGPLRDEPRGVYPYPARLGPLDLGRRGEFTAAAYHAYSESPVEHADLRGEPKLGPFAPSTRVPLKQAVNDWLNYFGVAKELVSREERHGHVLYVDGWPMIHVGTGVSQLLPIVVLGLLSQPDDILVIEHPELHLHPAMQSLVADFFLFLAMTGRQVIVETHSEHILNRVRLRIAQDDTDILQAKVAVHFAERSGDTTSLREVSVNPFGAIPEWPKGFFDEAASEAEQIIRAAMYRRGLEEEA